MTNSELPVSHISRRSALGRIGSATAAAMLSTSRLAQAAPAAQVASIHTVSHQAEIYHGWSTLARRASGELLLVCSGGREEHVCPFGRVEMQRSLDDGVTWTWPRTVSDGPIDDRDAGVLETAEGTILVTTFTSLAFEANLKKAEQAAAAGEDTWNPDRLARWLAARDRLDAQRRQEELGAWVFRSTDGGASFSARINSMVNSPHGPIQLSDGRLLYAGKELWHGERRIGACQSTDDGATWTWLAQIPTREGDNRADYHELHAVEAPSGRIVAQIRNHNEANRHETLQCESADGGASWSVPHSIGVWGYPSHLLRLSDGRLLMSYGHRRAPLGNQARVSSDEGRTWSEPMVISGDGTSGDLGYPSTVELADGTLLTAWYEALSGRPKAVLRLARWKLTG